MKGSSDEDGSGVGGASGGAGWLECIITHVVSLGMPVYIQSHLVQVVNRVDHVVSGGGHTHAHTHTSLSPMRHTSDTHVFL